MTRAIKHQAVVDFLKENPDISNRWVAKAVGVDAKTVICVRRALIERGEIPQYDVLIGEDSKCRHGSRVTPSFDPGTNNKSAAEKPESWLLEMLYGK